MCDYQGYEFGAGSYPDSVCVDGKLHDADDCDSKGNLYEPAEDIPCPMCQPQKAIEYWTEYNQSAGHSPHDASIAARSLVADIGRKRGVLKPNQGHESTGPANPTQRSPQ